MRHFYIQHKRQRGFTIVEIMVAVAIFAMIMVMGMSSLVSVTNSYRVTQQEKQVHDSLNYVLEMMTRDIRLGRNYHPNPDVNGGDQGAAMDGIASSFGFDASDGRGYIMFYVQNGILYRDHFNATGSSQISKDPLTNPDELTISFLRFAVGGTASYGDGDYNQPRVWIQLVGSSPESADRLTPVQTFVSQRVLDF